MTEPPDDTDAVGHGVLAGSSTGGDDESSLPESDEERAAGQGQRTETVRSGTRWTVSAQVAVEMSRLVVQLVLARLLVPADFGIVTLGIATIVFLDIFAALGTAPAIVQRPTISTRLLNTMFVANMGLGVVMYAIYVFVAPWLASSADRPEAAGMLRALGLAILISAAGIVQQGLIRRQLRFEHLAKANISQTVVSGITSVSFALAGYGAWSLVWGQLAGRLVLVMLLWRAVDWRPRVQFDWAELMTVRKYSLNLTGLATVNYFFTNADRLLVGQVLGAGSLGLYGLGQQTLMAPVRSITRAVQQVLFPTFSRMQDDNAAIARGYLRACAAIAAITFPAMAGMAVLAGPLIRTLFDERWEGAIPVVTILAPVGLLHSLQFTVGVVYQSKGRADWQFRWAVASGIVIVSSYAIGLTWGITGVAASYAVAVVVLTYPAFAIPFKLIDLKFGALVSAVAPYAIATALMSAFVGGLRWFLEEQGLHHSIILVIGTVCGALAYGAWFVIARPGAFDDLKGMVIKKAASTKSGNDPTKPNAASAVRTEEG